MKVAIDKTCINKIKDLKEFEYIYIFDDEPLKKLLKLGIRCVHKDYIEDVDINLTNYNIDCLKKTTINDKDWKKSIKLKQNKYAIIVPNYNNDHRKLSRQNIFAKVYRKCIKSNI